MKLINLIGELFIRNLKEQSKNTMQNDDVKGEEEEKTPETRGKGVKEEREVRCGESEYEY